MRGLPVRSLLVATAAVAGALIAVGLPAPTSGNQTGYTIIASLTPPTRASGQSATLTCGWHPGMEGCGHQTTGSAVDWIDSSGGLAWYFRGFFATSNPAGGAVARGTPLVNQSDPLVCDRMKVWITEFHHGTLRAAPIYTHTNITNSSQFTISGSLFGTYYNRQIGNMINDQGLYCSWTGYNVHEWDTPVNASTTTSKNSSRYPPAQTCGIDEQSCGDFVNNSSSNWVRRFQWLEGAP